MSSEHIAHGHEEGGDHEGMSKRDIWKIFFILLGITLVEFFIALVLVQHGYIGSKIANPIYIILTLGKAYFIVAFFMHLKFEKLALIYTMIVPILFIVGLILVLTNESHYWIELRKLF